MNIFVVSSHNNIIKCLLNKIYGDKQHTDEINFQYCAIVKITISGSFNKDMKDVEKLKFETKFLHEGQVKNSENNKNSEYKYLEFKDRVFDDTNNKKERIKFLNEFGIRAEYFKQADNSSSFEYVFYLISNAEPKEAQVQQLIDKENKQLMDKESEWKKNTTQALYKDIEYISKNQKKRIQFFASDLASSIETIAYCIKELYNRFVTPTVKNRVTNLFSKSSPTEIEKEVIILPCSIEVPGVGKCDDYSGETVVNFRYLNCTEEYIKNNTNNCREFTLPREEKEKENFSININLKFYFKILSKDAEAKSFKTMCDKKSIIKMIIEYNYDNYSIESLETTDPEKQPNGGKKYNRTRSGLRSFRANGRKNRSRKMRTANRVKHIF